MDLRKLIEEYLDEAKTLQVATVSKNKPWVCTVFFAFDEKLNLYWLSKPSRRHSKELRANSSVAGTIVLPHVHGQSVRGIQLEGTAEEIKEKTEAQQAMEFYANRFEIGSKRVSAIVNGTDGHLCYKLTPVRYVLFDEVNFPKDPRREYEI